MKAFGVSLSVKKISRTVNLKLVLLLFASILGISMVANAGTIKPEQIETLKQLIFKNTKEKSNQLKKTDFNGSFDWHSDVHGHWALLSMARITNDAELENELSQIFTLSRIKKEIQFLNSSSNQNFELPYGRAWFLMLLFELSQRPLGGNPEFQQLRLLMTSRMLEYLKTSPFPEIEWVGHFSGQHDSWMMALFLTKMASQNIPQVLPNIEYLVQQKMLLQSQKYLQQSKTAGDFISLPALNNLITETPPSSMVSPALPKKNQFACHDPGYLQISNWPLSFDCGRGSAPACQSTQTFNQSFFARTDLWKDKFDCVSHWVPQFMWMSHWLSLGSP